MTGSTGGGGTRSVCGRGDERKEQACRVPVRFSVRCVGKTKNYSNNSCSSQSYTIEEYFLFTITNASIIIKNNSLILSY